MKKYRVMYHITDRQNDAGRTEEVCAAGWRVESDKVVLFSHDHDADIPVFDLPKARVMRIQEMRS